MARKDIEIRVRAKDDASRNAKKISDALKLIGSDGKKAGAGAKESSIAFAQMAADASKLQGAIGGLKSLGGLIGQMDKAGDSVARISTQMAGATKGFEAIRAITASYAQQSADLTAKIKAEEAAIAGRNADLKTAKTALTANKDATLALARAQDVLNGKTRKGVSGGGTTPSKGVGVESGAPQSSARASFGAFLAADIANAEAAKSRLKATVDSLEQSIKTSEKVVAEYGTELRAVSANEKEFATETTRAGNAVLKLRADLVDAKGKFAALEEDVRGANAALGTLALSQDDVAAAAARATEELRQQERALPVFEKFAGKRLTAGRGTIAEPSGEKQAIAARNAREELEILRAEQAKLDTALRSSSGNVTTLVDQYNRMSTAVRLAEEQIRKLEIAQRLATNAGQKTGYGKWIASYEAGLSRAATAEERAAQATVKSERELGKIRAQAQRVIVVKRGLAGATDRAAVSLLNFGRETRTTLSFMQRMRGEVIALAAAYIGLFGAYNRVAEAANAYRAVEAAQTRLGVAFAGDTGKVAQEMAFLRSEADRLGFTFKVLASGYSKISIAAANAGFTIEDTRKLFTAITEAARVNGSSVEDTNGILKAFEQILNKGKIQAEELTSQIGDRGLPAFKLFADALGVTTDELGDMMKAGEVLANRDTLLKAADRISAVYSGQLPQALASTGFAIDSFSRSIEKINLLLAEGLVKSIQSAAASLADFINTAEGQEVFRSIGEGAGVVIALLAQIPQYFDRIALAAKALITVGVARWAASLGMSIFATAATMAQFSRELTLIGPRVNALSGAEAVLSRAVTTANGTLLAGQRALLAYGGGTGVARIGVLVLSGTLGLLRTTMIGLAGVARFMWAAIGGPIGIAAAAVSLVIFNWETAADRATSALQEHERQVKAVRDAYMAAGAESDNWAENINGATLAQGIANLDALKEAYADATKNIEEYSRQALAYFADIIAAAPDDPRSVQAVQINDLAKQFRAGSIDAKKFAAALDNIALTTADEDLKAIALGMLDLLNSSKDGATSVDKLADTIKRAEARLRVQNGTATEADKVLLGLVKAVDAANEAFFNKDPLEEYSEALGKLKSEIPSLADDLERLQKVTELNAAAWTALVAAWNSGDFSNIKEVLRLWVQGTAESNTLAETLSGLLGRLADLPPQGDVEITGGLVDRIIGVESGGDPNAKNPNSSATGLGQFIESTWLSMFRKYFPDRAEGMTEGAILELRKNAAISRQMVELYAKENAAFLDRFGVTVNDAALYLAHFLGPKGALAVLQAPGSTPTSEILGSDQINANASILEGRNAAEVIAWAKRKVGISDQQVAVNEELAGQDAARTEAEREAVKLANERTKASRETIADLDFQIAQQERINGGKEREAAIEDALRAARAENPQLTAEQVALIREKTGLLYDQQNAQKGIELSEERVNALYNLRQQLLEQMQMATDNGDQLAAEALRVEIEGLNAQLETAITSTIAMWTAIGGPEADLAIAKLNTMGMSLRSRKLEVGSFGLSMETWYGSFQSAVQGIVGAFDSFAQAVVNGENAFTAFGQSVLQTLAQVLQQIAAAIIQMQILKMLQGFGGTIGGFATQMLGAAGHTGGVVGSRAIGSGNKMGRPDWMRSALTYHTGGVAGFRPDEVSATLKKGEEVLTEEDPRHRFNAGGTSSGGKDSRLTQILAIGEQQIEEMVNRYGKNATLTHIKSEAPTIRRMLGL